jgi:hypothetical protein
MECTQKCYTIWRKSSKISPPKRKESRTQVLHLSPLRNCVSKDDESGRLQETPIKEPRRQAYNIQHGIQQPPSAVDAWSCRTEFLCRTEVNWSGGWSWRRRGRHLRASENLAPSSHAGRPPPIVLTSQVNLIHIAKGNKRQTRQGRDSKEKDAETVKTRTGRVFSSSYNTTGLCFEGVLRSNTQQQM